jgi:hypothetical protein
MKKEFVRKTMKKMAAIGTGVAMLGATLTGAMALDLADYPSPFVADGVYDDTNVFVVGDSAIAEDTLGVLDIGMNLQYESRVATASESGVVSVEGGKTESIPLGGYLSASSYFDATMQDDDVANLWDGVITFQGSNYDTSEELGLTQTGPAIATSLSSSDDDYGTTSYLEVAARDVITFSYKFDESINLSAASTTQPLTVDFMGDTLQITSIDSATKFTAYVGEEHYMTVDESVVVEGMTVTLIEVSSSSAIIEVDGVSEIISSSSTETINGLEVTVDDVFSRTERAESSANLIIGIESSETYQDGEAYIGEDADDPNWRWNLAGLTTQGTSQTFQIENDFVYNDLTDNPIAEGECLSLPNEYIEICFDSLTVLDTDYSTYTIEFDTSTDFSELFGTNTSVDALYLHTTVDEGFELVTGSYWNASFKNETTTAKAKEVWLYTPSANGTLINGSIAEIDNIVLGVVYMDTSDSKAKFFGSVIVNASASEILRINTGNTKDSNLILKTFAGSAATTAVTVNLTLDVNGDSTTDLADGVDDLDMVWGTPAGVFASLGSTAATEEGTELSWGSTNTNLGSKDESHLSRYGIMIDTPKSNSASDSVVLSIPNDQVMANIVIQGSSTTVTSGSTSYTPQAVSPVSKLASEISSASTYNLILVGGPCANDLVDDLFEYTCDGWSFEEGEAVIKLVDNGDKVALLVAGTSADDTRRAATALADYASYELTGTEVMVSGTSMTDITIGAVEEAEEVVEEVVEEEAAEEVVEEEAAEETTE